MCEACPFCRTVPAGPPCPCVPRLCPVLACEDRERETQGQPRPIHGTRDVRAASKALRKVNTPDHTGLCSQVQFSHREASPEPHTQMLPLTQGPPAPRAAGNPQSPAQARTDPSALLQHIPGRMQGGPRALQGWGMLCPHRWALLSFVTIPSSAVPAAGLGNELIIAEGF